MGKTLLARLLMELLRDSGRPLVGFDLNPREPLLAGRFPKLVWSVGLLADTTSTKVIDLGYGPFEQFFTVMQEIGFVQEARRRSIEPIVLFVTDPAAATTRIYAELQRRISASFVPVHNESVSLMFSAVDFPPTRPEYGTIRIQRLSPIVRGVIDRPNFSFNAHMDKLPGGPTEVHQWIGNIYADFRNFELRLLMGRLNFSLTGMAAPELPPAPPKRQRWLFR